MIQQGKINALDVLAKIKEYRSYQYSACDGKQVWITSDLETFAKFLDTVEKLVTPIAESKEEINVDSERSKLSDTFFTNEGLDLMLSEGKVIKILSGKEMKKMKKEVKFIEKWYPKGKLKKVEKMCKGIFPTLHEYQLLIARFRKGEIYIFKDGNDIFITGNE